MMSAILSVDALNDYISPGVACIKPVESLPLQHSSSEATEKSWEVTTEDQLAASTRSQGSSGPQDAQISLTDCLACSGCVTSAEAVLISLQSHEEVLSTLDTHPELAWQNSATDDGAGKFFVATVSPQARANIAATYNVTESQAGNMIEHLLRGPYGLRSTGRHKNGFTWVLDSNTARRLCLEAGTDEVLNSIEHNHAMIGEHETPRLPVLASACPGWICYAEKTHPHILPHLSRLKSPQAMTGTMIKSVLSQAFGIAPDRIWHVAIMPCFDKKLEASRQELTDVWRRQGSKHNGVTRDVDCVITAKELLMLADSRGISISDLPKSPVKQPRTKFPDPLLDHFLFSHTTRRLTGQQLGQGSSGGYAYHILEALQPRYPGSSIRTARGRNLDVIEYNLVRGEQVLVKTARYYGFRNIQNLVRALKPMKASRLPGSRQKLLGGARAGSFHEYAFVEVMACPGGCTNGGGQIKASDLATLRGFGIAEYQEGPIEQKQWLTRVDEAYFSADGLDQSEDESTETFMDSDNSKIDITERNLPQDYLQQVMQHWSHITNIAIQDLSLTTYKAVESNVGRSVEHVAASVGGGW